MIIDQLPEHTEPWQVCIVGTGPVGMAMALELDRMGLEVLVLESGGRSTDSARSEDARAVITNARTHAPMEIATCRALGGTSWAWGGRCVPFDDVDFEHRPWVRNSDWPLTHGDLRPWYRQACDYLLCGSDTFEIDPSHLPATTPEMAIRSIERWAKEPRIALRHQESIHRSPHITLSLNSTVVNLDFNDNLNQVSTATVATPAGQVKVRARRWILALGGVETTRLMLSVQRKNPSLFGGSEGPLGRFYMGHISGKIANIVLDQPSSIADLDFLKDDTGSFVRRRFTLTPEAQRKHQLLNTAFFPDNPPFYDHRHRSGVLSAVFLALAFPMTGRKILPEGIRLAHIGNPPRHYASHLRNVLLGALPGSRDIVNIFRERLIAKPRKPGFLVRNPAGTYALHYHGEQEPNPHSRITLTKECDRFGLPRAVIDFRFVSNDFSSVVASHRVLDQSLRSASIGWLEYRYPHQHLEARVEAQASDGYHQAGTTRMGVNPADSVVDANLKVHGVENLYVASSSVFPTTGQANSTLPAVAFGLRLVHHLQETT